MADTEYREQKVAAIVAAFNESGRIGPVVDALVSCPQLREVIVVDDGSKDGTAGEAAAHGARVLRHEKNRGKALAMQTGTEAADADIFFFCDADMKGLTREMIADIIEPVAAGETDMMIGMHDRAIYYMSFIFSMIPILGGLRAVRRELWEAIPVRYKRGFMIEAALNFYARYWGSGYQYKVFDGLAQTIKEKKYGFLRGMAARLRMEMQVFASYARLQITDVPPTVKSARVALTNLMGAGAAAVFGTVVIFASYAGPARFLREVFAEELQKDDGAPIVQMFLYVATNAGVDLIATIGFFILAFNVLVMAFNIQAVRYLWYHRPAAAERVVE